MTDVATECLPPDPSVSGLWWLGTPSGPVLRAWQPKSRTWGDTDGGRTGACSAHDAGWTVMARAVPPGCWMHMTETVDTAEMRRVASGRIGLMPKQAAFLLVFAANELDAMRDATEPPPPAAPAKPQPMQEDDLRVRRAARAICRHHGFDPNAHEPGGVTVPWNAGCISERNMRHDGLSGSKGDAYREHWVFRWRRYVPEVMTVLRAVEKNSSRGKDSA